MSDTALDAILRSHPRLRGLDSATLSHSAAARIHDGAAWPLDYVTVNGFAPEIARLTERDSAFARATADVLAHLMRGAFAGYSDDQAFLAAALYAAWGLPFGPAATVLVDPRASAASRSYAVVALRPHWSDARFVPAAAAALCSMAARSAGMARLLGASDSVALTEVLDHEEFELVTGILGALGSLDVRGASLRPRLRDYLPEKNPVSAYVRQGADQAW